jgi:O-antigen/teichoic acid export membrane protein
MVVSLATSFITNAVLVIVALRILCQRISWRHTVAPVSLLHPRFKEIVKFVLNRYAASLIGIPTKSLDINLLGKFTSLEVVGLYRIAKNFTSAIWQLSDPAFYVIYPELAKLQQKKATPLLKLFIRRITLLCGLAGIVLTAVSVVAVPRVIDTFMGAGFGEAGQLFQLMVWSVLFWMPLLWVNPLLLSAGRPDLSLRATLFGSLATLLLLACLIPLWGGRGAALAYGMSVPLTLVPAWWMGRKEGVIFPLKQSCG